MVEEEFSCENCGESFDSKKALTAHKNFHCDEKHKCDVCGETFDSERGLHIHQSRSHEDEENAEESEEEDWAAEAMELKSKLQELKENKSKDTSKESKEKTEEEEEETEEAEIGKLKVSKSKDGSAELYFNIGGVELPVKDNFRIGIDEDGMFLEATKEDVEQNDLVEGTPFVGHESGDGKGEERGAEEDLKKKLGEEHGLPQSSLEDKSFEELEKMQKRIRKEEALKEELSEEYGADKDKLEDMTLEELKEYKEKLEKREEKKEDLLKKYDIDEDELEGKSLEELKEMERELDKRYDLKEKLENKYGLDSGDLKGKDSEELEDILEEKEEEMAKIKSHLKASYGFDEEELEDKTLAELREIKDGKEEKEKLIDELSKKYDVERDVLDKKSLEKLKNLKEDLESLEEKEKDILGKHGIEVEKDKEVVEKDEHEEAERVREGGGKRGVKMGKKLINDLDVVEIKEDFKEEIKQGEEEEEEEEEGEGLASRVTSIFGRKKEKKRNLKEATLSNIEKCKEMEDLRRASVLLAHVLKEFLEIKMGIERELTYMEVIDRIESDDIDSENEEGLKDFYRDVHLQEYRGEAKVDFNSALKLAENTVKELA